MRKILLALTIIFGTYLPTFAQPRAMDTRVEFQKGDKAAAVIELPYNQDIVEDAIRDAMLRQGIKEDKTKGFQAFRGARLTPTDGEVVDLYFRVDRKSRKEDNVSLVYLIIGRPNENVALRTGDDVFKVEESKTYLQSLIPTIEAYNLEVIINQQDNVIRKAEKRLSNLQDDQRDYEKKISNFNEKLAQTRRDIESQTAELARQRAAKDAMMARRTTSSTTTAPLPNQ